MKRFLSLLLAVLMVVGVMAPLTMMVGAEEGETSGDKEVVSDLPNLIITELVTNAQSHSVVRDRLVKAGKDEYVQFLEVFYIPINPEVDADVSKYYVQDTAEDGTITYKAASGTAVEGTQYFLRRDLTGDQTEVVEYYEIYNAGSKPINLYDYKIARDNRGTTDNTNCTYVDMAPGAVEGTKHGQQIAPAGTITAFEEGVTYYTRSEEGKYVPVTESTPVEGTNYYVVLDEGYYVTNPEYDEGWLQPGDIAVVWNYNSASWLCGLSMDHFIDYHEYRYGPDSGEKLYYDTDLSDVLCIAIDCNGQNPRYAEKPGSTFWLDEWGEMNYGIVPDYVTDINDTARYDQWESWVFWASFVGFDWDASLTEQTDIVIGQTTVTGTAYLMVYDEITKEYRVASTADGTADANGKAVEGVRYYKPELDKSDKANFSNKINDDCINYLYGFDATVPLKEGTAYTIASGDLTPGALTTVQAEVLPNYSTGKNVGTSTPDLVITEVVPDNVGSDTYEFVEVVNTSGTTINIFDYSFVAKGTYNGYTNEYFSCLNPIIPGDVGNILTPDPGSKYYNTAPSNVPYENGWLQPGETAVLWSYYTDSYNSQATFADFRNHHGMDESVKLFAMDADNNATSGRGERQNLGNSGNYIYGIVKNENVDWYGDVYTSNPVFKPITYASGITNDTVRGIAIEDVESFVLCFATFAACDNVTLGEDYGYQFIWDTIEGTPNKFGAYMDMAHITYYTDKQRFSFTGSVVDEDWKASPGTLVPQQKTGMTTNKGDSLYVLYMEDFNGYGTVEGYDSVSELLGIGGLTNNSILNDDHLNNVKVTEKKGINFLEIRDGKLYVNNKGKSDDYMLLMSDEVLNTLRGQNFTVKFAMSYSADSANGKNGYSTILYDFDGASMSYGEAAIRVSGYGHSAFVNNGTWNDFEDGSKKMSDATVTGKESLTLYEKLYGDIDSVAGFSSTLDGSVMMAGKSIVVQIDVSVTNGVTVTVNGQVVSQSYFDVTSATASQWNIFIEEAVGSDIVMKTTPDISVAYDYITVYTDSVNTNAADMDIPNLYITELNVSGGNQIYKPGSTEKTNLGWIEFIEVTNGSEELVNLADYVLVSTSRGSDNKTELHDGNNLLWCNDWQQPIYLADLLGIGDNYARLSGTKDGLTREAGWLNPGTNHTVLRPGESAVIFTVNGVTYDQLIQREDKEGNSTDFVTAARSWLNIPESTLCILAFQQNVVVTQVNEQNQLVDAKGDLTTEPVSLTTAGFAGYDSASCHYGIGRLNDKDGNRINWETVYTHDYRNLECMVDINHTISNATGGYSFHYVYGIDNSVNYKRGTFMYRHSGTSALMMSVYTSGTTTVASGGMYNVGKTMPIQAETFQDIQSLKKNGYQTGGGLVITEFLNDTTNSIPGDGYDAYEALEITNTSNKPINLYDYALVRSTADVVGTIQTWGNQTKFRAGCPVSKNHQYYEYLKDFDNPDTFYVEPGEVVVVWLFCGDTLNNVQKLGRSLTYEDFRSHYEKLGNTMINAKDEDGEYLVKVLMADGSGGNLVNTSSRNMYMYGLAKKSDMAFNGVYRATAVVSYFVQPVYAANFDQRWVRKNLLSTSSVGTSVAGEFNWDEGLVEEVEATSETDVTTLCLRTDEGMYSFAKEYDANETYYQLYYYEFTQDTTNLPDFSFNIVYGNSMTSGWNVGALLDSVKVSYRAPSAGGNNICITSNPFDQAHNRHILDVMAVGARSNSLGYLIEEQLEMIAATNFTYVGDLADGTNVYFYNTVMGELDDVSVNVTRASVGLSGETTVSFTASINGDYYQALVDRFGKEGVNLGIITVRASEAVKADMIRIALLEAAGIEFALDENLSTSGSGSQRTFRSTAQKMGAGYYNTTFSAVSFVQVNTDAFGALTLYSENAYHQNATQILASAMFDYKDAMDEENGYIYEIASGKWSKYTAEQIARFEEICANN